MITTLHIIEMIIYIILALNVGYLLLFAIASKFYRHRSYPAPMKHSHFCVLFPAYKEDKVIVPAVQSFLQQDYPTHYDIIVISDQMEESTNEQLRQLPIRLLIADYTDSSKAKAMELAMKATADIPYDTVVIMDADNTVQPNFLSEINRAYQAGRKAIQAHRTAKNTNTDIAILDAASEEINNSIFRSGHIALGLSSALIGSGMALDATWFRQHVRQLETAGEDKELEALLLKQGIHIEYLEHVHVKDEKTQKKEGIKNQRKRWIAAQFGALFAAIPSLPKALLKGNIDYVDKVIQWTLPPRVLLLAGITLLCILSTLINLQMSIKWWVLLLTLSITLFLAIPNKMLNRRFWKAAIQVPSLAFTMMINLFKLKGAYKKFIHTEHGEC